MHTCSIELRSAMQSIGDFIDRLLPIYDNSVLFAETHGTTLC